MIQFRISGATPKSGKALCETCKYATITKGQNCEEYVYCDRGIFNAYRGRVPFKVAECGSFHPVNVPWLHEMEQMAWIVEARRRGPVGFSEPEQGEMEVVVTRPHTSNLPDSTEQS